MSILNAIFGNAPKTGVAPVNPNIAPAPGTPGNIPANASETLASATSAGTAPNGTVPAAGVAANNEKSKSPLDQFADLFNTDPNQQQQGQPLFNITQERVMETARKQDFSVKPTPEQAAAILAGGPGAVEAMMALMNTVGQNTFAQATFTATQLIEGGLNKGKYAKLDDVNNSIRASTVSNSLRDDNPLFTHPAAQPVLESVKQALLLKHPTSTPNEIANLAKQYIVDFAALANPQTESKAETAAKKADDWSNFLQ